MKTIRFSDGAVVPVIGQGTRKMGEGERERALEVASLTAMDRAFPPPTDKRPLDML